MELEEKTLKIVPNGEYKNIKLKEKLVVNVGGKDIVTEDFVLEGGYIDIVKTYATGKEMEGKYGKYYICNVTYNGEEAGFILSAREHEAYGVLGDEGSTIRITGTRNDKWFNLSFELK